MNVDKKIILQDLNDALENIKPLNFGRRIVFQNYVKRMVRIKKIEEEDVEEFLSPEFLSDDIDEEGNNRAREYNQNKKNRYMYYFVKDGLSLFLAYKLIEHAFF